MTADHASSPPNRATSTHPSPDAQPSISLLGGGVFVAALVVYLATLAPTVTGEDSGELIAAAYTLGIPHPPGYPLWCLVTRLFMLIPVGDIAWRANLGSAVAAAGACALSTALLARLGVRAWVAASSSLLLAASSTLWSQAVIAEVYGLSLLLLVALLYCLVRWRQTVDAPEGDRWMAAAALLTTLSLGAHQTVLILTPLILLWVVWVGRERLLSPRRLALIFGALLAGLSVQLYLPLRAAANPAMNWGRPDTFERFWAHVTRQQYPSLLGSTHTFAGTIGQWRVMGGDFLSQWPVPVSVAVLVGALWGLLVLARRDRPFAAWLALVIVTLSFVFAWLLNFQLDQEGVHIAEVFFIPAWLAMLVAFAAGVDALAERFGSMVVTGAVVAMAVVGLVGNHGSTSMRGNDVARRYATDLLATVPQGGILFTSADYEAFPVAYLQIVEGKRPDVIALDEQRDIDRGLKAAGLEPSVSGRPDEGDIARLLLKSRLPICSTRVLAAVPGTAVHPVGLLYRTFNDAKTAAEAPTLDAEAWKGYPARSDGAWRADWSTASMLVAYDLGKARGDLAYRGDARSALALIETAASRLPGDPVLQNSLGALLVGANLRVEAITYYDRAIGLRPDYREAHINKVHALIELGRWDDAQEAYARATQNGVAFAEAGPPIEDALLKEKASRPRLQQMREAAQAAPRSSALHLQLALALVQTNRLDEAEKAFRDALQVDSSNAAAWRGLGMLEARNGRFDAALEAWSNAIRLDPSSEESKALAANVKALEARKRRDAR